MNAPRFHTLLALLLLTQIGQADGLDTWTWQTLPGIAELAAIAYGSGQFVAVGSATWAAAGLGIIVTSEDGTNWVRRQLPTVPFLYDIAYGNGQFVAVGERGTVVTSADGVNWVQRRAGAGSCLWSGIAYGNGQFVAVGPCNDQSIISSIDGVDWVEHAWDWESLTPYNVQLAGIGFGDDRFVAVGGGYIKTPDLQAFLIERVILASTDGVNWLLQHAPSLSYVSHIAYGNGQFVGVGCRGDTGLGPVSTIVTSADGVNWFERSADTNFCFVNLAFGSGRFVATGHNGEYATSSSFITSSDGVNWVRRQADWTPIISAIAYGDGHFVAAGWDGAIGASGSTINLSLQREAGTGSLALSLEGPSRVGSILQTSTDLASWRDLTNITGSASGRVTVDGFPVGSKHLFFRACSQ